MVAIDLGGRTTKAVLLHRHHDSLALARCAVLDAPIYEKTLSVELLTEHLRALTQTLEARGKPAALAIGLSDALLRHVEMPRMPVEDLRQVLKINAKNYLQQDLPNHVFDCFVLPPKPVAAPGDAAKVANAPVLKQKVLVAGAKRQLVEDYTSAVKSAGLQPDQMLPGMLGPINAFENAYPEQWAGSIVALVDLGFKNTSISILAEGELALNRVVALGGDRLTAGLAENLGISYAEAEGIKVGMAGEVQPVLEALLTPLGRELRASIDFFEHQHDRPVAQVYVSGGSARSDFIVQTLQNEMMVECQTWLPTKALRLALPPQQMAEIEQVAPQLTTALGAALAAL